jgi:hypothetical protein
MYVIIVLSNLRRSRERSRSKPTTTKSPSKAKPLHILPELAELSEQEEEDASRSASPQALRISPFKSSSDARQSSYVSSDASAKKRSSRRVVLTGVEGLTFDDFFPIQTPRPAPLPPTARPQAASYIQHDSPLDSLNLHLSPLGLYPNVPTSPSSSRGGRSPSPTPSVASAASASTVSSVASTSSARAKVFTPPTSDDESHETMAFRLARAPTHKSHRGTIGYVPGTRKSRSVSEKSIVDLDIARDVNGPWPETPVLPTAKVSGRSRFSKPLPSVPRLSVQVCFSFF